MLVWNYCNYYYVLAMSVPWYSNIYRHFCSYFLKGTIWWTSQLCKCHLAIFRELEPFTVFSSQSIFIARCDILSTPSKFLSPSFFHFLFASGLFFSSSNHPCCCALAYFSIFYLCLYPVAPYEWPSRTWTLVSWRLTLSTESVLERMAGQGRADPACPETSAPLHMVRICE